MSTRQFPLLTSALLLALTTAAAAANDPTTTAQTEPPVDTLEPIEQAPPMDSDDTTKSQRDDLTDTSDVDLDPLAAERNSALDPASDVDTDADDDGIADADEDAVANADDEDAAADAPGVAGDDVASTDAEAEDGTDTAMGDGMEDDIAQGEDDMTDEIAAEDDGDPIDHTSTAATSLPQAEPPIPGRTGAQLAKATREHGDLDNDGDGSLTADEVPDSLALSQRFDDYDIDDDNLISLNEYQSWMAAQDASHLEDEQRMAEDTE